MKLKWQQAPVKTQWGDDMVVASVAIDNDHTLSLYCERDQTPKVEAMFTSPPAQPVQDNPLDCGVYLGSGKGHEIKHHVSYGPAQPVPDAFEQLMREADKPTQVPEEIAKCVNALMDGTHEITSVTIRPKRTWVGLTDEDMRSKFEQWHGANFVQPLDLYNNSYRNMHVRNRWQGWVAAHGIKENT